MEWKTIIISIISSSSVVTLIGFFIKKSYEKLLDKKIEEAKEENRRKSKVYDDQFNAYILFDELVYRARNTARDIKTQFEESIPIDHITLIKRTEKLNTYNNTIIELLFEKRAILSKTIFKDIHELKHIVPDLIFITKKAQEEIVAKTIVVEDVLGQYQIIFEKVDKLYTSINNFIQKEIKVK